MYCPMLKSVCWKLCYYCQPHNVVKLKACCALAPVRSAPSVPPTIVYLFSYTICKACSHTIRVYIRIHETTHIYIKMSRWSCVAMRGYPHMAHSPTHAMGNTHMQNHAITNVTRVCPYTCVDTSQLAFHLRDLIHGQDGYWDLCSKQEGCGTWLAQA
jgi:hypothetical protein